jgi:hypothetical protein
MSRASLVRPARLALLAAGLVLAVVSGCGRTPPFESGSELVVDAGASDAGTCAVAADCPGSAPACDDLARCPCGTSRVCRAGMCGELAVECPPDAGPPPECRAASDCPAAPRDVFCGGPPASASCVDGRCVDDCGGPRVCAVSAEGCRSCDDADATCPTCEALQPFGATVESTRCRMGAASSLRRGDRLRASVENCPWAELTGPRGRVGRVGAFQDLGWVLQLPDGTQCLGTDLPTGAKRISFACPGCTAVVRFD